MSTITFNAAAWSTTTKGQIKQIENGFDKLHKRIAIMHHGAHALTWSHAQVYTALNLPDTDTLLRVVRLRYLAQMVRVGQPHFWALVQIEQRWYQTILEDLAWLQSLCTEDEVPDGTAESWSLMCDWALRRPQQWKRLLKRAQARAIAHHRRRHEWEQWYRWVLDYLTENAALQTLEELRADEHFCLQCAKSFATPAALAVHAFKIHSRKNIVRYFVDGQQCVLCLKHFSSVLNLQNHVKRSKRCLQHYMSGAILVEPEPGVNSKKTCQAREAMPDPVLQGEGPRFPAEGSSQNDPFVAGETRKLLLAWTNAFHWCTEEALLVEHLRTATKSAALFPAEIRQVFKDWQTQITKSEEVTLRALVSFRTFELKFGFDWFQTGVSRTCSKKDAVRQIETITATIQDQKFVCYRQPVYTPVIFAHLFSGHRRFADVQDCIEKKGYVMISVDIIFNVTLGDLNRPDTFALFKRALEENVLQGIVAGPPCETWSRARGKPLSDGTSGPRVVRTNARPYGRVDLTRKEDEQVTFGSRLLAVAVKLLCIALVNGKTGVLEHPAGDDNEPWLVSIWKTSIMKLLQLYKRVSKVQVLQGFYGGKTVKPTDLLLVNATDNAAETLLSKRTTSLPLTAAIGKDAEGKWKTSELKVYPPDFCEAIATLCADSQPRPEVSVPSPEWFGDVLTALNASFDSTAKMGQDFGNKGHNLNAN